jgi:hypothetical protein
MTISSIIDGLMQSRSHSRPRSGRRLGLWGQSPADPSRRLRTQGPVQLEPLEKRSLLSTFSYQSSGYALYASLSQYDPATDTYTYASASVTGSKFHSPGGGQNDYSYGYLYYSSYNYTTGESCYGFGQVTDQSIAANLSSGSASGTVTLYCTTYDSSTGTYTNTTKDIVLAVDLQATSAISTSRYSTSFKDPSHYNLDYNSTGSSRSGTATFTVDGAAIPTGNPYYGSSYGQVSSGRSTSKATYNP